MYRVDENERKCDGGIVVKKKFGGFETATNSSV
jgi:hypothetical protein